MHLLNVSVAVTSAVVGTFGATMAYGTLNTTPVGHTEPVLEPVRLTHYLPCEAPSRLIKGVCVTTVIKTVVRIAEPIVITKVVQAGPSKSKASTHNKADTREDGDHEDEDEGDEDHEHGDDDEHEHGEG